MTNDERRTTPLVIGRRSFVTPRATITTLCIYLLLVFSVIGAGKQAFHELWLTSYLVKDPFHRRLSDVEQLERRFAPLRSALPAHGEIGYLGPPELDDHARAKRFMKVGYVFAPLRLRESAGPQLVVTDVDTREEVERLVQQYGLTPVVVLDDGVALLTHPTDAD